VTASAARGKGKTMTVTTSIGMDRDGSTMVVSQQGPRSNGLSAFNILAAGMHGFLPPQQSAASGSTHPQVRGLDRIEGKRTAGNRRSGAAFGKADALATLWISVPFVAMFVLGCLTLA